MAEIEVEQVDQDAEYVEDKPQADNLEDKTQIDNLEENFNQLAINSVETHMQPKFNGINYNLLQILSSEYMIKFSFSKYKCNIINEFLYRNKYIINRFKIYNIGNNDEEICLVISYNPIYYDSIYNIHMNTDANYKFIIPYNAYHIKSNEIIKDNYYNTYLYYAGTLFVIKKEILVSIPDF